MQTFLPYSSFTESAKVLDNKRLGKQRVEAYQILKTLLQGPRYCKIHPYSPISNNYPYCSIKDDLQKLTSHYIIKTPWYNHPAVQMWKGHEWELCMYGKIICDEWINCGFKDTMRDKFLNWFNKLANIQKPPWLGNDQFHASHRANLLRKDPKYYGQFRWKEKPSNKYYWPTKNNY